MAVGFVRDTTTKRNKTKGEEGGGTRKTREKVKLVIGETRGIRPIRERERERGGNGRDNASRRERIGKFRPWNKR